MLTKKIGEINSISDVTSGQRVDAQANEFFIGHSGSIICAGRNSVIVAKAYSFVIAESGSRVIALPGSFVVKEKNANVIELDESFVLEREIDKINPRIYFVKNQGETYPDHSFIIAYPGAIFKTGYSSIVLASSNAKFEMGDFSFAKAKENCQITVGNSCEVSKADNTVEVKRNTFFESPPRYTVLND